MLIKRDIASFLTRDKGIYVQILIGPRQCGKSTLFAALGKDRVTEVTFDDLQIRTLAENDPALFLSQYSTPLLIDEVQYAPNIFPEIKRLVDIEKKERVLGKRKKIHVLFYLTGSNQILLDKRVKESLVGRASYYYLNTLSLHEIKNAYPKVGIDDVIFKGGWPELYINRDLDPTRYLNDYVRNYIEKDIVASAGIVKKKEFHTVLGMLAARTGNFLNCSSVSKDSGVRSVTIDEWVSILERTQILYLLPPVSANLNKRLIKAPKIYFLDTGLAARLQGWAEQGPMMNSPQAGALFETLVLSELVKFIDNFGKNWKLSVWRTKDKEEVDFILENEHEKRIAIDAKLGIHGVKPMNIPRSLAKTFPDLKEIILVTFGGKKMQLSKQSMQLPISELTKFLLSW